MDRATCFLDLGRDTSACLMLIAVLLYYGNSLVTFVWISSDRVCSRLFPAVRCSPRMPRRSPCWSRDPLRSKRKEQYEKAPHIVRNTEIESHPPPRHNVTKMGERNIFLIHFLLLKFLVFHLPHNEDHHHLLLLLSLLALGLMYLVLVRQKLYIFYNTMVKNTVESLLYYLPSCPSLLPAPRHQTPPHLIIKMC